MLRRSAPQWTTSAGASSLWLFGRQIRSESHSFTLFTATNTFRQNALRTTRSAFRTTFSGSKIEWKLKTQIPASDMYKPAPPRVKKTNITRSRNGCEACRLRRRKVNSRLPLSMTILMRAVRRGQASMRTLHKAGYLLRVEFKATRVSRDQVQSKPNIGEKVKKGRTKSYKGTWRSDTEVEDGAS